MHIFSSRGDLVTRSFEKELETQLKYQDSQNQTDKMFGLPSRDLVLPKTTIIQYPHAVSWFGELGLSRDYLVKIMWKKHKSPVLICMAGRIVGPGKMESQGMNMYWGNENNHICEVRMRKDSFKSMVNYNGIDQLKQQLGYLLPGKSILYSPLETADPLGVALAVGRELGIFLGGTPLDDFLAGCKLEKEHLLGKIYHHG